MFPSAYIQSGKPYCTLQHHVCAPYFRKTFFLSRRVRCADLTVTGLGFYRSFVNGTECTKGLLAPYRSNPDDLVYFDRYDVTASLQSGKNVLALLLGNGMQNAMGAYIWDFDLAKFRSAPKTAFALEITYEDGSSETVLSDEETKTADSPILFDDLHYGEYYDAAKEIPGWNLPDFDDRCWKNAVPAAVPQGAPRLCEAEPIRVRKTLSPVSVTKYENGFIYDFGSNHAGLCRLKIRNSQPGQKILLQYFEQLRDGKPHLDSIRFNRDMIDLYQEDIYHCAGREEESYLPSFTYHGFQYVLITGITESQATKDLLTYLVMNSDLSLRGDFSCDNEIVNRLQTATVESDFSNFYYFPTDCPQREKNGWTADAALSSEQMMLNLTPEISYREWIRNICKAMNDKGQLPGIIPTAGWGFEWGNGPAWDNVIVYLPYYVFKYRGDVQILEEVAAPLLRYLRYLQTRRDDRGLIAFGLGDWCQVGTEAGSPETPLVVTDSILSADIANKAAFFYKVLGMEQERQYARNMAEDITKCIRDHLIDRETMTIYGNTQTGQAMGLFYNIFTEEEKSTALYQLLRLIQKADGHLRVGVLGGRVLFRVLADNGYADLALHMIARTDAPSFGNWVDRGYTTLWEDFYLQDGYPRDSINHHFWGDISAWFYLYPAGIRINPTDTDLLRVDIAPCFAESLRHVKAHHTVPAGDVAVEWSREGDAVTLTLSVPREVHGELRLPDGYTFADGGSLLPLASGTFPVIRVR